MLWQAICAVVALALLLWFAHVNQDPVPVYAAPTWYADLPVWIVGCVGALLGIVLEFAFTRRLWQGQSSALRAAESQLRRVRARAKTDQDAIAERDAKIAALQAELGLPPAPEGEGQEEDVEVAAREEDGDEVGI